MSSRRRVDAPETSFSFQIPTTAWGDDFLLEDDSDFLKGAEDILATPAPPSRFALEPLTINDLTPRPPNAASSLKSSPKQIRSRSLVTDPQASPARPGSRKVRQPRPKPNSLRPLQDDTTALQSPTGERMESLRAQVNFLTQEHNDVQEPPPSDSPKAPAVPKKHSLHRREVAFQRKDPAKNTTVLNDGRMKGRQRRSTRLSSIAHIAATTLNDCRFKSQKVVSPTKQSTEIGEPAPPVRTISPDPSVGPSAADGMAGRSLMPSQNVLTDAHLSIRSSRLIVFKSDDDACQPVIENGNFAEEARKAIAADTGLLTVSQLSPQKCTSRGLEFGSDDDEAPVQDAPIESLRSSSKRPASIEALDENEGARARKKGRPDPASTASVNSPTPSSSKHVHAPLLAKRRPSAPRKSIRRLSSGSRAKETLVGRTSTSRGKAPLVVRSSRRKSGSGGSEKDQERQSGSNETRSASKNSNDRKKNGPASNQSQNSSEPNQMRDRSHKMQSAVPPSTAAGASTSQHHPATAEHARTARSNSNSTSGFGAKSSSSKVNILHATIPIGLKFHSDARLEARKFGGSVNPSESKKTNGVKDRTTASVRNDLREQRRRNLQNQIVQLKKARASRASEAAAASGSGTSSLLSNSIPDFKAIHASQEAELTRQRDRLSRTRPLPVVPVTPHFVSDYRLKERHKFEERVKVKEKRLKEEREASTREKQLQEERELRELRKKAVPKAHDVPEWYKDAPKKAKLGESV